MRYSSLSAQSPGKTSSRGHADTTPNKSRSKWCFCDRCAPGRLIPHTTFYAHKKRQGKRDLDTAAVSLDKARLLHTANVLDPSSSMQGSSSSPLRAPLSDHPSLPLPTNPLEELEPASLVPKSLDLIPAANEETNDNVPAPMSVDDTGLDDALEQSFARISLGGEGQEPILVPRAVVDNEAEPASHGSEEDNGWEEDPDDTPINPDDEYDSDTAHVRKDEEEEEDEELPARRSYPRSSVSEEMEERGQPPAQGYALEGILEDVPMEEQQPATIPSPPQPIPPPSPPQEYPKLPRSKIKEFAQVQEFIDQISTAKLEDGKLSEEVLHRLRHPEEPTFDLDDPDIQLSINLYLACNKASRNTYEKVRAALTAYTPPVYILSHYAVEKVIAEVTGVVEIEDDICVAVCCAFVGLFKDLQACPYCKEPRYDQAIFAKSKKKVARKTMSTIPLGPQIQALRRSPEAAEAMRYQHNKLKDIRETLEKKETLVYDDIFTGKDFISLDKDLNIGPNDTTIVFSFDGCQLYADKASECVVATVTIYNFDPTTRYKKKHVLPAIIIPGPTKPKKMESFLFRFLHHLSAIQRENGGRGLAIYDAVEERVDFSRIIFLLGTADAVALVELDGRTTHHGNRGCRLGCPLTGVHQPRVGHYFAPHVGPKVNGIPTTHHVDFDVCNCWDILGSTPSIDLYNNDLKTVAASASVADYEENRKDCGIAKPSLLLGLRKDWMLAVPRCYSIDLMHLFGLNLGEILLKLYRGRLDCETTDDVDLWVWATLRQSAIWEAHGALVAAAIKYFPSCFHRPPRNIALKINSGYKATEWFIYLFCLGAAFMRTVLPEIYWRHFCLLVKAVRILCQRVITKPQVEEVARCLLLYVHEYERLFYQYRPDRIHFCRQSIHILVHLAHEVRRLGPGCYYSQYTLERAIGEFGGDVRLHSNPFSNLMQIALRTARTNALKSMFPTFDTSEKKVPKYAQPLGEGYVFLRPRDKRPAKVEPLGLTDALKGFSLSKVRRWGRLSLPNGQTARSLFSEERRTSPHIRISRNIKYTNDNGDTAYGEVQFFFLAGSETLHPYALVSVYGPKNTELFDLSMETVYACKYQGHDCLEIIAVNRILSVVSMQPLPYNQETEGHLADHWFVAEKLGLDDIAVGRTEPIE